MLTTWCRNHAAKGQAGGSDGTPNHR